MKHIFYSVFIITLIWSCQTSEKQDYMGSKELNDAQINEVHPGKKLLETNCNICHSPSASEEKRLAPPMIAVKKHYISESTTKAEFINDIQEWVKEPSEGKAKMYGAIRRFGVMPKTPFPEETIEQIADFIFENDIEQPEWFEAHFQGNGGMKRGNKMRRNRY